MWDRLVHMYLLYTYTMYNDWAKHWFLMINVDICMSLLLFCWYFAESFVKKCILGNLRGGHYSAAIYRVKSCGWWVLKVKFYEIILNEKIVIRKGFGKYINK